jgi:hypothetical protein
LPEGVNSTLAVFRTIVPINLTGPGPFNASFGVNEVEVYISSVRFCNADGQCEQSRTTHIDNTNLSELARSRALVGQYLNSRGNKVTRARLVLLLNKLNALRAKFETRKVEAAVVMTDEMKKELVEITVIYDKDKLEGLEAGALNRWNRTLSDMATQLRVKI